MEKKKLRILCDMDGVLENLSEEWIRSLNEKFGKNVVYEDLTEWDISIPYPDLTIEEIISVALEDDFYRRLKPLEGSVEYLKKLYDEGHEILIVTSTDYQVVKVKMDDLLFKYYPFLSWKDVVLTWLKQYIKGDVLIDDGIHNHVGGEYTKILFTAPYNKDYDAEGNGMIRADNWKEVYETVEKLAEGKI